MQLPSLRPDRVFGRDSLSVVPMGPEDASSRRHGEFGKVRTRRSSIPLTRELPPNIFIPQIRVRTDEFVQHADALGVIKHDHLNPMLPE